MAHERILIVDDEVDLAASCQRLLASRGYQAEVAASGEEALERLGAAEPHLVITDLKMPGMGGMELLRRVKEASPETQVVMMTAYSTIEDAVAAIHLGAADFVPKPFTPDHLLIVVDKALSERILREENRNLRDQLTRHFSFDNIVGKSQAMARIYEAIRRIADTTINVLITGASGTGKELIARSIHANSRRRGAPFVPVNCGALPEHLVEGEIFGYEKGAFTGAVRAKPGLLEAADGGTFFMDEIGELSPALQVKFLRVLQDGQFRRLGSNQERGVDIRLICATNSNIEERVEAGRFREDLFYRINNYALHIPPLRERRDDIPLLANHFLQQYAGGGQGTRRRIAPATMELLVSYEWKGNVRELEHVIERAVILSAGEALEPEDLPPHIRPAPAAAPTAPTYHLDLPFKEAKERLVEEFERQYIAQVLQQYQGNVSQAAAHSGIDRRSLHRLLAKYGISAAEAARPG